MKKCYIDFKNEVCQGLIGTKEEVREILKQKGKCYDYEGCHTVWNTEQKVREKVLVFSYASYTGTDFICYKVN